MPSRIGQYTIGNKLGAGVTSVVKEAIDPQGKTWAIKIFDKTNPRVNETLLKALKAEVDCLGSLQHPNIVNMKEFCEDGVWEKESGNKQIAYIVLENVEGGELFDFIANGGPLSEPICRYYMGQMLSGIHYLHSKGVSHRDLKPENMLVDKDFNIKVADFGFAAPLAGREGTGELQTKLGTESYMAPEIHARQKYDGAKVDLFATAIILFIMITGHPPFSQGVPRDRFYKFISGNRADVFWRSHARNKSGGFSEEFMSLLTSMFQVLPHQRLTASDICGHPWMSGPIASQQEVRAEFSVRNEKIRAQKLAEIEEKAQKRAHAMQNRGAGAHRALTANTSVFMSAGEEGAQQTTEQRKFGKYNRKCHKNTEFLTMYPADMIFTEIQNFLYQHDDAAKIQGKECIKQDPSKWKMTVNFKMPSAAPTQTEEGEEQKQEDEEDVVLETQMEIRLKEIQGTNEKIVVEFSHTEGSKQYFYDQYKTLTSKVDHLNDCLFDE